MGILPCHTKTKRKGDGKERRRRFIPKTNTGRSDTIQATLYFTRFTGHTVSTVYKKILLTVVTWYTQTGGGGCSLCTSRDHDTIDTWNPTRDLYEG